MDKLNIFMFALRAVTINNEEVNAENIMRYVNVPQERFFEKLSAGETLYQYVDVTNTHVKWAWEKNNFALLESV